MNFILRQWRGTDLDSLVKYANNINIAKNLTDQFPYPYHEYHGLAFIDMASRSVPVNIFAIEVLGEAAGAIGIHPQSDIHRKNAELGYWLAEPYWGKGIMTKAVKQITTIGFEKFNVERIFARPFGTNLASQKVLMKAGYSFEACFEKALFKNGEYIDELYYAVRRNQWPK